jgi:hypothetical protein
MGQICSTICGKEPSLRKSTIPLSTPCFTMSSHTTGRGHAFRIQDPHRKAKVEAGMGRAQKTPLKGLRFKSREQAQAYLDRWEERWADTRIHGTTKRQIPIVFAEPLLRADPPDIAKLFQGTGGLYQQPS